MQIWLEAKNTYRIGKADCSLRRLVEIRVEHEQNVNESRAGEDHRAPSSSVVVAKRCGVKRRKEVSQMVRAEWNSVNFIRDSIYHDGDRDVLVYVTSMFIVR